MTTPRGITKISVPLYGGVLLFAIERKAFERGYKYLNDHEYPYDSEDGAGLTMREPVGKDRKTYFLSGVFDGSVSTVVHESGHVATIIMKRAGINAHDDDGESFCYLQEFLFDEMMKRLYKKPKKSKISEVEYMEGKEW